MLAKIIPRLSGLHPGFCAVPEFFAFALHTKGATVAVFFTKVIKINLILLFNIGDKHGADIIFRKVDQVGIEIDVMRFFDGLFMIICNNREHFFAMPDMVTSNAFICHSPPILYLSCSFIGLIGTPFISPLTLKKRSGFLNI